MPDEPPAVSESDPEMNSVILPDRSKLEALAEFAAGAGHEINNPLATIIGRAQLLLKDEHDPQRRQMLMSIGAQAYRIRDMIGDTMLFGRPPLPKMAAVDLAEVINQVVQKQAEEFHRQRCSVLVTDMEQIYVRADSVQMSIVISELLRNSSQALQPNGGEIQVTAVTNNTNAVIEILDHGKGFNDQERQHAFDPFFSGRQAGRGLGFGLPKCWRIVEQHQGEIKIESRPSGPTKVQILWKIA